MGSTDPKGEGGARERMPSAADVARIPEPVREHALVMLQLGEAARVARRRWYEVREQFKVWQAGNTDERREPIRSFDARPVVLATMKMWEAELAQEQGAATYRAQLAENNARPAGERWSPTALALWARCSIAAQKPA